MIQDRNILRSELLKLDRNADLTVIERKINGVAAAHERAINELHSTDRKTLLDEIKTLKSKFSNFEDREKQEFSREIAHLKRQCSFKHLLINLLLSLFFLIFFL